MTIQRIMVGMTIDFVYANWRGETASRQVVIQGIEYGVTPYHGEPQMYIRGFCLDRKAERSFAIKDMTDVIVK